MSDQPEALDILTENALVQSIAELSKSCDANDHAKVSLLEDHLEELCKRKHRQEDLDVWTGARNMKAVHGSIASLDFNPEREEFSQQPKAENLCIISFSEFGLPALSGCDKPNSRRNKMFWKFSSQLAMSVVTGDGFFIHNSHKPRQMEEET